MDGELTEQQCWRLLSRARVGRLALAVDGQVDIFPVNFLINDDRIFFRSAPGSKLSGLAASPTVAFEADGRRL
ncbi:MAG: pyridoxamine 5'-phosphate oxidase family protein, partial [Rhodoglobus sp.]